MTDGGAGENEILEEQSFEQALKRLESIADALEEGNISLEESLELFQEGMDLIRRCGDILQAADGRIEELIEMNEDVLGTTPLDLERPE